MRSSLRAYLRLAALFPLVGMTLPLLSRAERTSPVRARPARVRCYCNCEPQDGSKPCDMMCDLPKYQERSWATSCRKQTPPVLRKSKPVKPRSVRRNSAEFCRR